MTTSVLCPVEQKRDYIRQIVLDGKDAMLRAEVRYGDACRNGHNTFAITGSLFEQSGYRGGEEKTRLISGP